MKIRDNLNLKIHSLIKLMNKIRFELLNNKRLLFNLFLRKRRIHSDERHDSNG